MVASLRNISARSVTIGQIPPPPPPPSYTTQLHANASNDMVYVTQYQTWLNATAGSINSYWVSGDPDFSAPGATYSNVINTTQYKDVEFSILDKTTITGQGGGFGYDNFVGEFVIGSTLTSRMVVGLQIIFGAPNSAVSIYNQPGARILYDSTGSFTVAGADGGNGTTSATGFVPGDIVGVVWDITGNMGAQSLGFFVNGVLTASTIPDDIFISVGAKSFSYIAGPVTP